MNDFKITNEAVEAALFCTPIDADGDEKAMPIDYLKMGTPEQLDQAKMIMRAALEAALPVMFEQFGWVGTDAESGYTRIFETERELSRHAGNDWFSAAPLYRLKDPK